MLNSKNRLSKTKDVRVTMMRGRSYFSPHFVIKFKKSANEKVRATVVVSTKVSKNAVVRNRIKRVLREILRRSFIPVAFAGDYVIIVKPPVIALTAPELRSEFTKLLQSAPIIPR